MTQFSLSYRRLIICNNLKKTQKTQVEPEFFFLIQSNRHPVGGWDTITLTLTLVRGALIVAGAAIC